MDADEANTRRDELFLLDVRQPDEYGAGHVPGSVHIPMQELGARQAELPTDRTIVCVCRTGSRSGMVTRALAQAGYAAENLDGGLQRWAAAGHDLQDAAGGQGTVI